MDIIDKVLVIWCIFDLYFIIKNYKKITITKYTKIKRNLSILFNVLIIVYILLDMFGFINSPYYILLLVTLTASDFYLNKKIYQTENKINNQENNLDKE